MEMDGLSLRGTPRRRRPTISSSSGSRRSFAPGRPPLGRREDRRRARELQYGRSSSGWAGRRDVKFEIVETNVDRQGRLLYLWEILDSGGTVVFQ